MSADIEAESDGLNQSHERLSLVPALTRQWRSGVSPGSDQVCAYHSPRSVSRAVRKLAGDLADKPGNQ